MQRAGKFRLIAFGGLVLATLAMAALLTGASETPESAEAHYQRGVALAAQGQLDEAIAAFRKALELRPNYPEALKELGTAFLRKGQLDDALTSYRKALEQRPNYAEVIHNIGLVLAEKNQLDEAITYYQKAIALKPDLALAHYNLGRALQQKGQLDEAIAAYQKALALRPDSALTLFDLGRAFDAKGQYDEAIAAYRKAIDLEPDYLEAFNNLGAAFQMKGQLDDAIAAYQKALQLKPDAQPVGRNLASALDEKQKREVEQKGQKANVAGAPAQTSQSQGQIAASRSTQEPCAPTVETAPPHGQWEFHRVKTWRYAGRRWFKDVKVKADFTKKVKFTPNKSWKTGFAARTACPQTSQEWNRVLHAKGYIEIGFVSVEQGTIGNVNLCADVQREAARRGGDLVVIAEWNQMSWSETVYHRKTAQTDSYYDLVCRGDVWRYEPELAKTLPAPEESREEALILARSGQTPSQPPPQPQAQQKPAVAGKEIPAGPVAQAAPLPPRQTQSQTPAQPKEGEEKLKKKIIKQAEELAQFTFTTAAWSPDAKWIALGTPQGIIEVRDAATGNINRTLAGHRNPVEAVAFSADGRWLASGSEDNTIKLWDVATGKELRTFPGHGRSIAKVAFGSMLFSDWAFRRERLFLTWLAVASTDGTIKLWDVSLGKEVRTLAGHPEGVNALTFSRDGHTLASGGADGTVKLWEVETGKELRSLAGLVGLLLDQVSAVAFSPDGRGLASTSGDGTIRIWEAATAQVRHMLKGHGRVVACAAFGPDGRSLTTGVLDGMVKQWDVATGQQQKSFKIEFDVEGTSIDFIACSRDGNRLFVLDALVGEGTMWDVATGKLLGTLRRAP